MQTFFKPKKRMPEHTDRIASLSDDRIVALDAQHTQRRVEGIRMKFEQMRKRAEIRN